MYDIDWELEAIDCIKNNNYEKFWNLIESAKGEENCGDILQAAYDSLVGLWLEERFVDTEFMSELIREYMHVDVETAMKCWDDWSRQFLAIEDRNYDLGYYIYYRIGVSFWYLPDIIPVRKARALNQYPELRRAYFQEYDYSTGFIVMDLYSEGPLENFIEYFQLMCTNTNRGEGDGLDTYQGFIESIARVHPRSKKEYDYMVETCGEAFTSLNPRKPSNSYPYWYTSPSEEDDSVSTEINFDTSGLKQVAEELNHIAIIFEGLASGELAIADDEDQDDDWADGYDDDDYDEDERDWDDEDDDIDWDDDDWDDDYGDDEYSRISKDIRELDTLTEAVLIARGHNPADYTILSGRNPLAAAFGTVEEE